VAAVVWWLLQPVSRGPAGAHTVVVIPPGTSRHILGSIV
jgi:hypothetical protein